VQNKRAPVIALEFENLSDVVHDAPWRYRSNERLCSKEARFAHASRAEICEAWCHRDEALISSGPARDISVGKSDSVSVNDLKARSGAQFERQSINFPAQVAKRLTSNGR
jgi:hypothetical protein